MFVKDVSQTYGDLIVDNGGNIGATTLVTVPETRVVLFTPGVTYDAIQLENVNMPADFYVGSYVNPNVLQNATASLADDALVRVVANTATTLTVTKLPPGLSVSTDDVVRGFHPVDNLEVAGSAQQQTDGDLLALLGDRSSGDGTTLHLEGAANANYLDVPTFQRLLYAGAVGDVWGGAAIAVADRVDAVAATGTIGGMRAASLIEVRSSTLAVDDMESQAAVTLDGSTITASRVQAQTHMLLKNNSSLTHATGSAAGLSLLGMASLTVEAGSTITADGRGAGNVSAGTYEGGAHGGLGGAHDGRPDQQVYGDYAAPSHLGSGGYNGSRGGGRISIGLATGGTLTVHGAVTADGTLATASNGGGGSGGSVHVQTTYLRGSGRITAKGGAAYNNNYSGGGGGGRIAITGLDASSGLGDGFAAADRFNRILASGGTGVVVGAAGTVFTRTTTQTWGDLILNNETRSARTPLLTVPVDRVLVVNDTDVTLQAETDLGMTTDRYAHTLLKASGLASGGDGDLRNDLMLPVVANNSRTFQVDLSSYPAGTSLPSLVQLGDYLRSTYVFDNLQLLNNAKLDATNADIVVLSGDVLSNDGATLDLPTGTEILCNAFDASAASLSGAGTVSCTSVYDAH